jgi:hypothetical protein
MIEKLRDGGGWKERFSRSRRLQELNIRKAKGSREHLRQGWRRRQLGSEGSRESEFPDV